MAEAAEAAAVKKERWGYEVKTSSDSCISAINAYYRQVLSYGRGMSVILEAPACDPHCVLANILAAYFLRSNDYSRSQLHLQAAQSRLDRATSYEKSIFDAIHCLISEDRDDDVAVEIHLKLLKNFPRDLVSLKRAQLLCFYMGRPDLSLKFVEEVLPENRQEDYIYGMLAFPLLELGRIEDAEEAARKGLEINKQDCWTQHCLCHVLQYTCRFPEAVEFMKECSSSWNNCLSFMYTHNWWHVALCYLEGHSSTEKVLDIYDHHIWKESERSDAALAEVYLNALGLLMRLHLRGQISVSDHRLKHLVDHLTDKVTWYTEWQLDLLTVWALACTGEFTKAEDLVEGLKLMTSRMNKKKQQLMQRGISLAQALYMYYRGNSKEALELLDPYFDANDYKMIGASDEQLDVFNELWYDMMLNAGEVMKLSEVVEKRVAKREGIPFLWRLLERCYSMAGRPEATMAAEKAMALETAYFH